MGRIVASVKIENLAEPETKIRCDALVDTGASYMVLPSAWRERLGRLEEIAKVSLETATQAVVEGTICGPVRIQIEGFRPIYNEVLFLDMEPANGDYEPLIGYIILEQAQAAVDMVGHRLVPVKSMDLKCCLSRSESRIFRGAKGDTCFHTSLFRRPARGAGGTDYCPRNVNFSPQRSVHLVVCSSVNTPSK